MRSPLLACVFAAALGTSTPPAPAAVLGGASPGEAPRLTPAQALAVRRPADLRWSPDGSRLAFTIDEPPSGSDRHTHIWVYERSTGGLRQFTNSGKSERHPRWSPDGRRLAFLSDRDGPSQIFLLTAAGGEAWALTKGKRAVTAFDWSPDGTHLAYLSPDAKTDEEEKREKDKDDARVVDKDDRPEHLWLTDVVSGETRSLMGAPWKFSELTWTPAGDRIIAVATDHPESDRLTERIYSVPLAAPSMTQVLAPVGPFANVQVSPDGATLAFLASRSDGPSPHDLWTAPTGGGHPTNVSGPRIDRPVTEYRWQKDGALLVVAQEGFRDRAWTVDASGRASQAPPPNGVIGGLAPDPSGHIWCVSQHMNEPPEIVEWDLSQAPIVRTHLNATLQPAGLRAPEFVHYNSFDGRSIEAALLFPSGQRPAAPAPVVVLIHGGPTSAWRDAYETWGQLLASAGFVVFYPNVRGSTGYGHEFMTLNRGDWGGGDFKDVMAGVDWLVRERIADANRLGIAGWSYGGYMASWAITQTTRFKAAITGAGMSDLAAEFGTEDGPAYDEWFYGVPYEKPDGFRKSSPLTYVSAARTPTLILQGEDDVVDPLGQSQALYRALKRYGVETELVQYPREGHGLREEKHLLDRLTRIVAWFQAHLGTS